MLRDLGGTNGTYVNGARLRGACSLVPGDRIDIGPFKLTFDGTSLTGARRIGNVELMVLGVSLRRAAQAGRRVAATHPHAASLRIRPVRVRLHHRLPMARASQR